MVWGMCGRLDHVAQLAVVRCRVQKPVLAHASPDCCRDLHLYLLTFLDVLPCAAVPGGLMPRNPSDRVVQPDLWAGA